MTRPGHTRAADDRAETLTRRYWAGEGISAIVADTGLSKQRIFQLIGRIDPDHSRRNARALALKKRARQTLDAIPRAPRPACAICRHREILTSPRARTCGGECAEIWRTLSRTIDPEKWREHQLRCATAPATWKPRGDRRTRPGSAVAVALDRMAELREQL